MDIDRPRVFAAAVDGVLDRPAGLVDHPDRVRALRLGGAEACR